MRSDSLEWQRRQRDRTREHEWVETGSTKSTRLVSSAAQKQIHKPNRWKDGYETHDT